MHWVPETILDVFGDMSAPVLLDCSGATSMHPFYTSQFLPDSYKPLLFYYSLIDNNSLTCLLLRVLPCCAVLQSA